MKRNLFIIIILSIIIASLIGCTAKDTFISEIGFNKDSIKIVDMAGREILIPKNVDKIFSTVPTGTIILYTLSPDKIIGWNYALREGEKEYIHKDYHDLPNLGGAGKASINLEEILKQKPDIIIEMTTITEDNINKIDELQARLKIPVVLIDEDIRKLDESYELLGKILNMKERATKLSNYIKIVLENIDQKKGSIKDDTMVSVYYAEGPKGLETEPSGSWHAELIDMVGGRNVAEVDISQVKGKSEVSIEQVLSWDPEVIISWDDERGGYYSGILSDPNWGDIKAVKNKEVYEIVNNPFNWFDRPPSVNRILGIQWMGNLLYPEIYNYNIREVVKEFYLEFYHYDLSEVELDELLKNTIR